MRGGRQGDATKVSSLFFTFCKYQSDSWYCNGFLEGNRVVMRGGMWDDKTGGQFNLLCNIDSNATIWAGFPRE